MGDIEELIDLVLTGQHSKRRERCIVDRIVSVFEDSFGAYDAAGVRAVLADRRDEVDRKLNEEAREFSASNYGRDEWWLLLDPIEGASS